VQPAAVQLQGCQLWCATAPRGQCRRGLIKTDAFDTQLTVATCTDPAVVLLAGRKRASSASPVAGCTASSSSEAPPPNHENESAPRKQSRDLRNALLLHGPCSTALGPAAWALVLRMAAWGTAACALLLSAPAAPSLGLAVSSALSAVRSKLTMRTCCRAACRMVVHVL